MSHAPRMHATAQPIAAMRPAALALLLAGPALAQLPPVTILPSNLPFHTCELAAGEGELRVASGDTVTIDTDSQCDLVWPQTAGAGPLCVVLRDSIVVENGGVLRAHGSRAIALVAASSFVIGGTVDASAQGPVAGPGGEEAGAGGNALPGAGGGGGGHAIAGGAGGFWNGSGSGSGGAVTGGPILVPLAGGSRGGANGTPFALGGGGGGAIELVACDILSLWSTGIVRAGGGGGEGGPVVGANDTPHGGGGGGSGGAILVEADHLFLSSGGNLAANGGGGGGGGNQLGESGGDGADGGLGSSNAPGGLGATGAGDGGFGAAIGLPGSGGSSPTAGGAGGGGGGYGRIRLGGCGDIINQASVNPPPETANLCGPLVFASGFENGRLSAWSSASCDQGATVNESDLGVEADYCNLQWPLAMTAAAGAPTDVVYGRLYEAALTPAPGPPPGVIAQVGFAREGSSPLHPADVCGWRFTTAAFNVQVGNDDEFQASFVAPSVPGDYWYTYRFSLDGQSWTYCDTDGAGSLPSLAFSTAALGQLMVTP